MTIVLELPQTTDLLDPTAKLSSGFIKSLPIPVGLWCPSKLQNAAVDFNPLKKNFGALTGGITPAPGGFGTLGQNWLFNSSNTLIDCGNNAILPTGANPFTVAVLHSPTNSGGNRGLITKTPTFTNNAAGWRISKNASQQIAYNSSSAMATSALAMTLGKWYLSIIAITATTTTFYLNSVKDGPYSGIGTSGTTDSSSVKIGAYTSTGGVWGGGIALAALWNYAFSDAQASALYNCLFTGKPFPLFEPDTLYIDEPQTSTTLNLTSKSFVFSSSNSQVSIQRNINTQSDSLSDSQGNITFTRDLKSTLDSRSFSSSATSVLRPLNSIVSSRSESSAAETRQILSSSIITSQSFSSGKFALSAFINLESTAFAESFSYVEINLSRVLNSTGFSLSDLLAEISVKRNLSSIGLSLSDSISQETILRPLDSESISQAKDRAEISIERLLTSEILSSSLAKGQFTTQLYTKFEVLSYRRYSSQYFVQSGSVNDSGQ